MNLRYFERRTEVVRAYVRAENGCEETNHFVKPSAIELARIAEARNGRKKSTNMFPVKTYVSRRAELRAKTGGGLILLPGNQPSANNYPNNAYYFRQDSTFLYYFGLDRPSLAGVIDADTGEEVLFGDDFTVDDIIWTCLLYTSPSPRD